MAIIATDYSKTKHTGIKVHRDGITFLFDIRVDGKRYRKVWESNQMHSRADRLKTAYDACEVFRRETEHKQNITADVDATVNSYWEKLKSVSGWSETMTISYDYYFNKHLSKLGVLKVKSVRPSHFTSLNVSLRNLAPRTRLKAYEILKPLFALAIEDEIIDRSPIKQSHIPKRKQIEEKKIITDAESKYRLVYEAINTLFGTEQEIITARDVKIQCHDNPHHRAAFLLGFHGRRLNETLQLHWEDIDIENRSYVVRGANSKVNTDMEFTLPEDVAIALLEFRGNAGNVFNVKSLDRHHQKIRDYTGIQEFTYHWMRNLSVSALAGMGLEITHLSAMLGHNDSSTIRKYLSLQRKASTSVSNEASQRLLS